MDIKVIIILILVVVSFLQFSQTEKTNDALEPIWGGLSEKLSSFSLFGKAEEVVNDTICPDTENPVCGSNGVTYQNVCFAALEDVLEVTMGACEDGS